MSSSVLRRRLQAPANELDRCASAKAVAALRERPECLREWRLRREQRIDEELAHSFPASDPPSWVQGTAPVPQ
ncbi:MAG TPA: hypothetical protein VGN24_01835 [Rhodanobacter sp.]|nr:hypothetical protein [Rhodanobacter sp.]